MDYLIMINFYKLHKGYWWFPFILLIIFVFTYFLNKDLTSGGFFFLLSLLCSGIMMPIFNFLINKNDLIIYDQYDCQIINIGKNLRLLLDKLKIDHNTEKAIISTAQLEALDTLIYYLERICVNNYKFKTAKQIKDITAILLNINDLKNQNILIHQQYGLRKCEDHKFSRNCITTLIIITETSELLSRKFKFKNNNSILNNYKFNEKNGKNSVKLLLND